MSYMVDSHGVVHIIATPATPAKKVARATKVAIKADNEYK